MRTFLGGIVAAAVLVLMTWSAQAVVLVGTGGAETYQETDPGYRVSGSTTSIWSYVGTVNGCSAVYLGNGWCISAGHVGVTAGNTYTLGGVTYTVVSTTTVDATADLVMFQLSATPGLTALSIGTTSVGDMVCLIGYGDEDRAGTTYTNETWGIATVGQTGYTLDNLGYSSTDFISYSTTTEAVVGDSGGAVFASNGHGGWTLVGIMNASGTGIVNSTDVYTAYAVTLAAYNTTIGNVKATPEPETVAMMLFGAGLIYLAMRRKRPCCGC